MGRPRKYPLPTPQVEGEAPQESVSPVAAPLIRGAEKPKKSGSVTVACKIPQGLKLQLQHKISRPMPAGRGGDNDYVMTDVNVFGGPAYHVFGPSMPAMGGIPDGYILPPALEGGFAFTPGIPADFWEKWLEQNRLADYVLNRMIFALDPAGAKAKATELKAEKSGLEPLSREIDAKGQLKDRRVPKPVTGNVGRIAYDAERDAERGNHSAE
jgi:hypothetical protein